MLPPPPGRVTSTADGGIAPVLFLVFKRPDTTARVFDAIRAARPSRLFIAADGPRENREGESERCRQVREIATAVDWPCAVETLFREENLGCKRAVSSAIDWYFDQVPEGLILEDDCLPDPSFFPYASELLARYRDDPRVMMISGSNFISGHWRPRSSYYFSAFTHIWGWASWRRAWAHYDVEMRDWPSERAGGLLQRAFPVSDGSRTHLATLFDRVARGDTDGWDYQWAFATLKRNGVCCMPAVNLISNIGFGADATHALHAESKLANLPRASLSFPLTHPVEVVVDRPADAWTARHTLDIDDNPRKRGRLRRAIRSRLRRAWHAISA